MASDALEHLNELIPVMEVLWFIRNPKKQGFVYNWLELLVALKNILVHGKDDYIDIRGVMLSKLYKYTDNNSCKRILNHVKTLDHI